MAIIQGQAHLIGGKKAVVGDGGTGVPVQLTDGAYPQLEVSVHTSFDPTCRDSQIIRNSKIEIQSLRRRDGQKEGEGASL